MELQKPPWVDYFMSLAFGVSMRSKDPKTQVGCVIVDSETLKILSIGYNGFPPGTSNTVENWSDKQKNDLVVHAEANAVLLKGGANLENSIAFVTLFPCEDCAKILIQAGVRKVYYLSFRDKYRKSKEIFDAAKVELVPVNREDDGTLTAFQNRFINMFKATIQKVTENTKVDESSSDLYDQLQKKTKALREKDIESPWPRSDEPSWVEYFASLVFGVFRRSKDPKPQPSWVEYFASLVFDVFRRSKDPKPQILFKEWKYYFLFLAFIGGTRSSSDPKEGALLLDSKTLKICSLSYKGYPRGVEGTPNDAMMVSAIVNVLALRFCEGNKFYAFTTNFPNEGEAKILAQAKVERLYFVRRTNVTERAISILEAAKVTLVPMNLLEEDIEKEIRNTFEGLADKERKNKILFQNWPKIQWTPYELEPKKRNQFWFGGSNND